MKKLLLSMMLLAATVTSAFAQFEKGKWYSNASISNFGLSYSERDDLSLGLSLSAGYMIENQWMVLAEAGLNCSDSKCQNIFLAAKGRYYIPKNSFYLGMGCKLLHEYKNVNDIQLTPEVGYSFFLNNKVAIEPSVYYDMSLTNFADYSKFGVKIGVGLFF